MRKPNSKNKHELIEATPQEVISASLAHIAEAEKLLASISPSSRVQEQTIQAASGGLERAHLASDNLLVAVKAGL
jgi:hypothetical protein